MEGGKIYGWKLSDKVTFGRFKGETDEFGFSVELNARQRLEITTAGLRWRDCSLKQRVVRQRFNRGALILRIFAATHACTFAHAFVTTKELISTFPKDP